jgi:hypothetical protein
MVSFQFHVQLGKQRKVGWVGDDSHVDFGQKFPGEKNKRDTVRCRNAAAICFVTKV